MRNLLIKTAIGTGALLLGGALANAQYQYQEPPPQTGNRVAVRDQTLDRVRGDLDRAQAGTIPFTAERGRIVAAKDQINQFQSDLNAGAYEPRELNQAIGAVQRVIDMNQLTGYSHDALVGDLARLQDMKGRLDSQYR